MRNRVSSATRLIVAASGVSSVAFGSEPVGPDITVGDITGGLNYGAVGEIHAYAFGFTACNAGDAPIDWQADTNRHPVFATQLYRLADGQFEQIGLAWAFHEFFPLELNLCGDCTPSGFTDSLGAGCGNANSAGLGGAQQTLGPRTEINARTGVFPFPPAGFNQTGDAVFKRLQASRDDLQTPEARFFVEGLYIAPDDAQAGNQHNNASHREVRFSPGALSPQLLGATVERQPAIFAWQAADPGVMITEGTAPDGGRYLVASRATEFDTGEWRYEYAVYNQNASRNAIGFDAPHRGRTDFPRAFDLGFHDVDYHSGEPVDPTDWAGEEAVFSAHWEVVPPAPLSAVPNELRWGTLYNFRFSSFDPPVESSVRITVGGGAGSGESFRVPAVAAGPARCSVADFAEPYFVLDLADIQRYIALFTAGAPDADLRPPLGVLDLADLQAFIAGFLGACE